MEKHNDFRDWGSITRGTYDTPYGQSRVGLWFDYVDNGVYRTKIDFDQGDQVYTTKATANPYNQLYHDHLTTVAALHRVRLEAAARPDDHARRQVHLGDARTWMRWC